MKKFWLSENLTNSLYFIVLASILILRFSDLGTVITPDEPLYLVRGEKYINAIRSGAFENTIEETVFGDTIHTIYGNLTRLTAGIAFLTFSTSNFDKIDYLIRSRIFIGVLIVLASILSSFFISKLLNNRLYGLVLFGLLIVDVFTLRLSRVVHVDALQGFAILLAIFSYQLIWKNKKYSNSYAVLVGVFTSIAFLQKPTAFALLPVFVLISFFVLKSGISRNYILRKALLILFSFILASVLIYPGLIVAPEKALFLYIHNLTAQTNGLAVISLTNYVAEVVSRIALYIVLILVNLNIISIVGLFTLIVCFRLPYVYKKHIHANLQYFAAWMLFIITFISGLSLGQWANVRYVFPAHLVVLVFCAIGISILLIELQKKYAFTFLFFVISIVVTFTYVYRYHPYYSVYTNPIYGKKTRYLYDYGWGAGIYEAVEYLSSTKKLDFSDEKTRLYVHYSTIPQFSHPNIGVYKDPRSLDCTFDPQYLIVNIPFLPLDSRELLYGKYLPLFKFSHRGVILTQVYEVTPELLSDLHSKCKKLYWAVPSTQITQKPIRIPL